MSTCTKCGGSGEIEWDATSSLTCQQCGGTGVIQEMPYPAQQQHQPTLLEMAQLTAEDAERLHLGHSSTDLQALEDHWVFANAATRKAFEVVEAWIVEKQKSTYEEAQRTLNTFAFHHLSMLSNVYQQLRNELHAQLQAQAEAQP